MRELLEFVGLGRLVRLLDWIDVKWKLWDKRHQPLHPDIPDLLVRERHLR